MLDYLEFSFSIYRFHLTRRVSQTFSFSKPMKDQDQTEESQPYYNVFHVLLGGVSTRQLHTSIDSLIGATTVSCPLLHFLNPSKTLGFKAGSSATDHIIWMLKQGIISSYCGLGLGALLGARRASLVYLAENAHRMPVTKGGWYMYHKHRNYAIIRGAARRALPTGTFRLRGDN